MKREMHETLQVLRRNRNKRFPSEEDARFVDGLLLPSLRPKFTLDAPAKVFTIGSCFARNIELVLTDYDIDLPTIRFSAPKSEWQFKFNGLLNEYNPGTMSQRILAALRSEKNSEETIIETEDGFLDVMLPGGFPVTFERAVARREEIENVYTHLASSDLVIITFGLVEAWFDEETGLFLNRMPPGLHMRKNPDRYTFRRLDVFDALPLLERAVEGLVAAGVDKILLTVSPVPLGATFSGDDAIVANSFSKAVLRVCAEKLAKDHEEVDYFPSFELVGSGGLNSFKEDNIHVKHRVVQRATTHMLHSYFPNMEPESAANGRSASAEELPAEGEPVNSKSATGNA